MKLFSAKPNKQIQTKQIKLHLMSIIGKAHTSCTLRSTTLIMWWFGNLQRDARLAADSAVAWWSHPSLAAVR